MAERIISDEVLDAIRRTCYEAGRLGREVFTVRGHDGSEIVRCRDCVHFSDGMIVECERLSGQPYWTDADGFCAWGMPRKRGDRE